jgi:hypothetical protein
LVEARDGVALLTRREQKRSEVAVQMAGQTGPRYISDSDFTAKHPSLSPKGTLVAYVSEERGTHIVIASLITETRKSISATTVDPSLSARQLTGLSVCSWSPVHWSPDENRIAFFACTLKPVNSYAVVADLSLSPPAIVWVEDKSVALENRMLIWLNSSRLLVSEPSDDGKGQIIETVEVSPSRP